MTAPCLPTSRPRRAVALATAVALALAGPAAPLAAEGCASDAMLVFDGSASMAEVAWDTSEPPRIEEARKAVARALPQVAPFRRIGLVVYGPGSGESCSNIALRFRPIPNADGPIIRAVNDLVPGGLTPLTASVQAAAEALDYRTKPGIVVLVTDGNETCGGRPCALGTKLMAEAQDLTIHVIGFRVVVDFWAWQNPEQKTYSQRRTVAKCLADLTGGTFVGTETVDELVDALNATLGCPLIGALPAEDRRRPG